MANVIEAAGMNTGMLAGIIENSLSKQGGLVGLNNGGSVANSKVSSVLILMKSGSGTLL